MIERLSFSSLEAFVTDRQKFYRRYILKEKEPLAQPLIVGDAVHQCIERYLREKEGFLIEDAVDDMMIQIKEKQAQGLLAPGIVEEEVVEEIMTGVTHALTWITECLPVSPKHMEMKLETNLLVSPSGYKLPSVVGVVDMVDESGMIYDWKCVRAFSGEERVSPKYILQASLYALLAETTQLVSEPVQEVRFVEIKKVHPKTRKNSEAPDVIRVHTIQTTQGYKNAVLTMLEYMHRELQGENMLAQGKLIPNVFTMFSNEEPWQYYLSTLTSSQDESLW